MALQLSSLRESIRQHLPPKLAAIDRSHEITHPTSSAQYMTLSTFNYKPICLIQELFQRELLMLSQGSITISSALKLAPPNFEVKLRAFELQNRMQRAISQFEIRTYCQYEASQGLKSERCAKQTREEEIQCRETFLGLHFVRKIQYQSEAQAIANLIEKEGKQLQKASFWQLLEMQQFLEKCDIPNGNFAEKMQLAQLRYNFYVKMQNSKRIPGIQAYQKNYNDYIFGLLDFRRKRLLSQIQKQLIDKKDRSGAGKIFAEKILKKVGDAVQIQFIVNYICVFAAAARAKYERLGRPQEIYYPLRSLISLSSDVKNIEIGEISRKCIEEIYGDLKIMDQFKEFLQKLDECISVIESLAKELKQK
ncbi:hypothetical protein SS50377_24836 [Spironucleus salmonicida]|uniref:Uncharacterized protein n=1 Tax=Spironucleus salmonicida TaxID=348837 RepID=V6LRE0_9EUKA|nr:hypothetical protein SS50377_24836 [Spironucleus salmonicida]|eukprot:EST46823.1 Hypothetical protein SS50377_13153 [Spironucleus salmonicida]